MIATAIIPTYTFINGGLDVYLIDTPGFGDTNSSDTEILQDISSGHAQSYTPTDKLAGIMYKDIANSSGIQFRCTMSCDWATDSNHEEADLRNGRMKSHFRCPDEDDMNSVSSHDQESLFGFSHSESNTAITVDSSSVQHEVTHTNIEHMLAVLKAERGKCLRELRGLDAA